MATCNISVDLEDSSVKYGQWLATPAPGEEVVITGLAGQYPESANVTEFAENLFNKVDMLTDDCRRWDNSHPEIPPRNGKILTAEKFDAGFFGASYKRATSADPAKRKNLEAAIEAILDAGLNPSDLKGTNTGIFIGMCFLESTSYWYLQNTAPGYEAVIGNSQALTAHEIAYFLKVKGPVVITDTACSSSLTAFETAYRAIRNGDCERALVLGNNILLQPGYTLQFFRLGVLSADGVIKPFDADGHGYVRSEIISACVLQKAKEANRIYCTVVHAKTNSDGFKNSGITFPSADRQIELLKELYTECQVNMNDISFVEAHATGTKVGDPEELKALEAIFLKGRDRPLLIGSLKSNIGHTEPGSGLGSITKAIIALETGYIPPNINYNKPRAECKALVDGKLKVVTSKQKFEDENGLVAINNFGFGGSNCHVLLKYNPKSKLNGGCIPDDGPRMVCVSGRNENAVETLLDSVVRTKDIEYMRLLQNAFRKNIQHNYRGFVVLNRHGEITRSRKFIGLGKTHTYIAFGEIKVTPTLFKELSSIPVFLATINRIQDVLLKKKLDMKEMVEKNGTGTFLSHNLASVLTQIAIIDVLKSIRLQPSGFFGNYNLPVLNELICAYYDGIQNLQETVSSAYSALLAQSDKGTENHIGSISNNVDPCKETKLVKAENIAYETNAYQQIIKIQPKSIILQLGDITNKVSSILAQKKCSILTASTGIVQFLTAIGRLYEAAQDVHIHNLFPPVAFPVSRGTPMISPEIKWIHNKDWFLARYDVTMNKDQMEFGISIEEQAWKFAAGHVIDGRILFPATGYLFIVWETLAAQRGKIRESMEVVFENCKFKRACALQKGTSTLFLSVLIHRATGNFQIQEDNAGVVSGRVYIPENSTGDKHNYLPISTGTSSDESILLTGQDFYKELRLRGYHYSGEFRGVQEYDSNHNVGLIKWNDNWIAFMDNMLQMQIMKLDSRLLYVPTSIDRVYINGLYHQEIVERTVDNNVPTYVYEDSQVLRAGGIEFRGLHASVIPRKKYTAVPVLEEYTFVPNVATLTLSQSLRVNMQLLLENAYGIKVKAVEIIDEAVEDISQPLSPLLSEVLLDIPLIKPDITILTKRKLELDNVKVENKSLLTEAECSLVIGSKLLQRRLVLDAAWKALTPNGFILSREELDVDLTKIHKNITVLTEHSLQTEKLVFFRRSANQQNHTVINVSSSDKTFSWLPQLQATIKNNSKVILYAQNDPLNGIIGLVNCVRTEGAGTNVKAFFVVDEGPRFETSHQFYRNQIDKNMAINVYKQGAWGTYRHLLIKDSNEVAAEHCYVNSMIRGDLSSVSWVKGDLKANIETNPEEILVHIYYAALNFRDVMMASGKISVDVVSKDRRSQECITGFEFSGRTRDGRRIMGMAISGALSTLIVNERYLTWDVPENWTLEDAATVPVVYGTCLYAFLDRAHMKPGESVLIHSGTGGVGQAAITLALGWGCTVFTTVGTKEKREYLLKKFPKLTDNNIGNSRDTSFEALIMKETDGRGVDVVLNSLAEEKLLASVRCLAQGGRFLEIGKYDLGLDNPLRLLFLEKEASFHGIMLDSIFGEYITTKAKLFNLLRDAVANGLVKPLPRTVFKDDEVEKAFRFMSLGKHTGKIVVKIREEENTKLATPATRIQTGLARYFCDKDKSYIICGGLGGFGLELADWLVLRGCQNLVLSSRKGLTTGYQSYRISIWRSYGCSIKISTHNIDTRSGIEALINEAEELGPVGGVFNLAVVLQDGLLENQTLSSFETSFKPKAFATQYLDEVTRLRCPKLNDFVVFSSVSCGRGNLGQTNYGMANSVMERICEKRRNDGYPGLAIEWGAVGEVGLVAQMAQENIELEIGGTLQQRISNCLEVMDTFLTQTNAAIVSSIVVAEKKVGSGGAGDAVTVVANIIGITDLKLISYQSTLAEIGMDSMSAVEIKQTLEREFDMFLTPQEIKNLTFFRLKEIQTEKESGQQNNPTENTDVNMDIVMRLTGDEALDNIPIIKLDSQGTQDSPKVFLFPGIEGTLTLLNDSLVPGLEAEVFGLQYSYDNQKSSIEEMAKLILPLIEERTSKSEPLNFVAYSFGTIVALECLRILERKGYHGKLISIDGGPKLFRKLITSFFASDDENEFQTKLLIYIMTMDLPSETILKYRTELYECKDFEERLNLTMKILGDKLPRSVEKSKMFATSIYTRIKACMAYQTDYKVKSVVNLIKPSKYAVKMDSEDYELSSVCENPVNVQVLEGHHVTLIENPMVAKEINAIFKRV